MKKIIRYLILALLFFSIAYPVYPTTLEQVNTTSTQTLTNKTLGQLNANVVSLDKYSTTDICATTTGAIDQIGATATTLMIPSPATCTANKTVPSTLTLWVTGQGKITVSTGITLTINGSIEAPLAQVFSLTGTGAIAGLKKAYPQWFGAKADGTTDDTSAIRSAINALIASGTIIFPATSASYRQAASITLTNKTNLAFVGEGLSSVIKGPGGANGVIWSFEDCNGIRIENLSFDENALSTFGGIQFSRTSRVWIRNNRVYDSSPVAAGDIDRFAFVGSVDVATPNTDFWIENNHIVGFMINVDSSKRIYIKNNYISGAVGVAGIAATLSANNAVAEDYYIQNNTVVNPTKASGGAAGIEFVLDPVTSNSTASKRVHINDNHIISSDTGINRRGILIGTADAGTVTTGNVFEDIVVNGNIITFLTGSGAHKEAIYFNASATNAFFMDRVIVSNNTIQGLSTAGQIAIDLRRCRDSIVTGNNVNGYDYGINMSVNPSRNLQAGNRVNAVNTAYQFSGSDGNNRIEYNSVIGSPTTRFNMTLAASDYLFSEQLSATATLNFDLTAVATQDLTITVTGAALGDTVSIGIPNGSVTADTLFWGWVSAANTVTIRAMRIAGTPDPASGTFRADVLKH